MSDAGLTRLILENARDYAIFTVASDGRITSWGAGAEHVTGYSEAEAVGMHMGRLFVDTDRMAEVPTREISRTLEEGRAEDTRWHVRKDGRRFWANGVSMRLEGGEGLVKVMRDETHAKLAEDQRVLLLNELNHRIKNTLSIVQSLADQTLRSAGVERRVRDTLADRLVALSEAHNVLVAQNWAGADLATIVVKAVSPHERSGRIHYEGPPVRLSAQQAVSVSLALTELTTNAIKYGALSVPDGRVRIGWNLAYGERSARTLTLLWQETGGPPVSPPRRKGFGTRLIDRSFGHESGGRARLEFAPEGVRCVVELPLSATEEDPLMMPVQGDPSAARART